MNSKDTTIYCKSTHTGQYMHVSSFTPWGRKVSWLRALVHHAHKICNNSCLLTNELQRIAEFASWNGYPCRLANKLIKLFSLKDNDNARANLISQPNKQVLPTIWIHLPYIGKKGMPLIKSYTKKISCLLKSPSKFTTTYPTNTYILIILIHSLDILPFVYIAHNKVPKVGVLPITPEQD